MGLRSDFCYPEAAATKLKYELEMGVFVLSKSLMTGLPYSKILRLRDMRGEAVRT
jgi:hypothetical protein